MKTSDLVEAGFRFESILNWEDHRDEFCRRLRNTALLEIPHLFQVPEHEGACVIVGAGPSLAEVRVAPSDLDILMTLNGVHDWFIRQSVAPNIHVISEHDLEDAEVALGGPPCKETTYYIASHCHQNIFSQLRDYRCVLWHAALAPQEFQAEIHRLFPDEFMINAGHATFFKSLAIGSVLGYRTFEIFGVDSSFEGSSHVAGYKMADLEPRIKVWAVDPISDKAREFTTQGGLAFQAKEFLSLCSMYHPELRIKVHGDGMLHYLHRSRYPELYED
jgi:hypothetical protein